MHSLSYICHGDSYDSTIWELLFQRTKSLDEWGESGMKFIILGTDLQYVIEPDGWALRPTGGISALAIATISTAKFTEVGWNKFIDSLQPHFYDEEKYEVKFNSLDIKLNVYNLFYKTVSSKNISPQTIAIKRPELLFYEYYKSGTMLTFSTCATMYRGGLQLDRDNDCPGPISQEGDASYRIQLNISGQDCTLCIRQLSNNSF